MKTPPSSESSVLARFERVRTEIAKIQTIEDALKLRSQSEALRVYAVQIKCSKEILHQIAETKVRAERRLGELLTSRPETRGGDRKSENQKSIPPTFEPPPPPTLENLGVSKHVSSRSQLIAAIPADQFEERIEYTRRLNRGRDLSAEMFSFAKYLKRQAERESLREKARQAAPPSDRVRVLCGDFREVLSSIPDRSTDLILTDPPYLDADLTELTLWADLSAFAARVLKKGKLLVAYCGSYQLFRAMQALNQHLDYVWTAAMVNKSFPDTFFKYRFKSAWKPLTIWTPKEAQYQPMTNPQWFTDVVQGGGVSKEFHEWQQPASEAEQIISTLTYEGDLVCDPFCGSGAVALASKSLRRRFVGADINSEAVNVARYRLLQGLIL